MMMISNPPTNSDSKVKILLVDDHEENLTALEAILDNPTYDLVMCTSGRQALRHLLNTDFALVLLDVMMPDLDGFELATLIHQRERSKHTPIIFLTAVAKDISNIYRGYRVGAVDYLQKPLEPDIVVAKVAVFVDLFRKTAQVAEQAEKLRESERLERKLEILELRAHNERRYKSLADAIPQIVWTANADGNLRYLNQQWNYYGDTQSNALNEGWHSQRNAFLPKDFNTFIEAWKKVGSDCTIFECQSRLRRTNSTEYRWHLCRALPERDINDVITGWLGTWTDIHDQKQMEEQQRFLADAGKILASSLDFEVTLKSLAELVIPFMADWCVIDLIPSPDESSVTPIVQTNQKARNYISALHKASSDNITLGKIFGTGVPRLVESISSKDVKEIVKSPEMARAIAGLRMKSLMSLPLEVRDHCFGVITFVRSDNNRCYRDADLRLATKLVRNAALAIENAKLYEVSRDTNRLRDEFLATISHELRTPLSAVIGWSELLLEKQLDIDSTKCLETVYRNAKMLGNLVDDLLDVSRIITGKIAIDVKQFEIAHTITAAVEAVRPAAQAKGISITTDFNDTIDNFTGDAARMQQIAWNLISNAIKFTAKGGHVHITLNSNSDAEVVLKVSDDGIGIDPAFIPHIFERFRQADGTTTRKAGGLGLGLAIVRHLVELHGGRVEAASEGLGKGCVFTVYFPTSPRQATADSGPRTSNSQRHLNGETGAAHGGDNLPV